MDLFWSQVSNHILISNLNSALAVRDFNPESDHEKLIAVLEEEMKRRGIN